MYCQKCGSFIDNDATFCTRCGAPVKPVAPPRVNTSNEYDFDRFTDSVQQPRRVADPTARRYADAPLYEDRRQQPAPRRAQIDPAMNDTSAPSYRERPTATDNSRRASRIKNEKWPVSVKVFSIISFVFLLGYYIAIEADRSESIELFACLPYLLSSLLSVIAFFSLKKTSRVLSMIPLWIVSLGFVLSIIIYESGGFGNAIFHSTIIGIYYGYIFGGIFRLNVVYTAMVLFWFFALLYTISGFLRKKRTIALPIIMAVLLLPTALPFCQFWVRQQSDIYIIVFGIYFTAFLIAYLIAAFSLLPQKERRPYTSMQTRVQKFCPNCGIQYAADKKFCDQCASPLKEMAAPAAAQTNAVNPMDEPSGGFAALGFFIPLVGLILYLTWRETFPRRAHSAGKGALIGVIVSVSLSILLLIAYFVVLGAILHMI